MRKALVVVIAVLIWGLPRAGHAAAPSDFEAILDRAKAKIFPALVFVKPIVEDYESGEKKKQEVFGSGVIISPTGLVLTNHHVVEKAIRVNCVLSDRDQVPAKILGKDPETDLALLQLQVPKSKLPLPFGVFGDSDKLTEGDFVMALGSPFGFTRSISLGIVSNTQRYLGFENQYRYNLWIQTDAAINPGNSGGPLVNTTGQIVGINTLGLAFVAEGMGFSIPSNVARRTAERLEKDGSIKRAWVGLHVQPLKDFFSNTFTSATLGVVIDGVDEGSPAAAAGMRQGDILERLDGANVVGTYAEDLPRLNQLIADLKIDTPTTATVRRGGKALALALTPVLKGKVEGDDFDCRRWNMTLKEINKFTTPTLYFHRKQGVFIQGVRYPGNASSAGLQQNDIILSIDNKPIASLADVKQVYESVVGDAAREKKVMIQTLRGGTPKWMVLEYSKDYDKED